MIVRGDQVRPQEFLSRHPKQISCNNLYMSHVYISILNFDGFHESLFLARLNHDSDRPKPRLIVETLQDLVHYVSIRNIYIVRTESIL
jgi:hypothetical protein